MKTLLYLLIISLFSMPSPAELQNHPAMSYTPVENFLKLPAGVNFGPVSAVALNSKGHIFVFHRGEKSLMEFTDKGKFVKNIGNGFFKRAHGLRIDAENNIWVTDVASHLVIKFNPQGEIKMVLGKKDNAGTHDKRYNITLFNKPTDVAFNKQGDIFVSDGYGNSRVVKFDKYGNFVSSWGDKGSAPGQFDIPHSITIGDDGLVYVADRENNRVQIFNQQGEFIEKWTHVGMPSGLFLVKNKYIFICDPIKNHVLKLDLKGNILGSYGRPGKAPGQMELVHFLAVDDNESIYVAEINNWRVQKFAKFSR